MTISFVSIFTYRLDFGKQKYVTAGSASIRNRGDAYRVPPGGLVATPETFAKNHLIPLIEL